MLFSQHIICPDNCSVCLPFKCVMGERDSLVIHISQHFSYYHLSNICFLILVPILVSILSSSISPVSLDGGTFCPSYQREAHWCHCQQQSLPSRCFLKPLSILTFLLPAPPSISGGTFCFLLSSWTFTAAISTINPPQMSPQASSPLNICSLCRLISGESLGRVFPLISTKNPTTILSHNLFPQINLDSQDFSAKTKLFTKLYIYSVHYPSDIHSVCVHIRCMIPGNNILVTHINPNLKAFSATTKPFPHSVSTAWPSSNIHSVCLSSSIASLE